MNECGNDRRGLSRRAALRGTALALGVAAAAPVAAQQKLTQAIAQYQATPKGNDRCGACANFQAPNACKFVAGEVSPTGWCQLFSAKT